MIIDLQFHLEDPHLQALCEADARLAILIHRIGSLTISLNTNYFETLVSSIIGQQLSVKAAKTIRNRLIELLPAFTPEAISIMDTELLRNIGLSYAKISYIKDLSEKMISGFLEFSKVPLMSDQEVMQMLVLVKGIGPWTAEMFLLFSLGRLDIIALKDAGLQRATKWLYQLEETKNGKYLEQVAHQWAPYRSIAAFYLWEAINIGIVDSSEVL